LTDVNQRQVTFDDENSLAAGVADLIQGWLQQAAERGKPFHLVLAGGSTPEGLYRQLAQRADSLDWSNVHFWFSDERCVPPDHPDSNYRMVRDALLHHIDAPARNIHRIPCERSPQQAALEYDHELARNAPPDRRWPRFDLVLLGVGVDGHTASLFPGTDVLSERDRGAAPVYVEKPASWRVSLTYPVLNDARRVLFLVAGEKKAGIVSELLGGKAENYPAGRIRPKDELIWCLDKPAAALLPAA